MVNPKSKPARNSAQQAADDARNEEFATLLRDGAKAREARARASDDLERAAAVAESQGLLALAHRSIPGVSPRPSRGWIKG
jgi:hypothetical protein